MLGSRCLLKPCTSASISWNQVFVRGVAALPALRIYSVRRRFAEKMSNKFNDKRQDEIGPDYACLEWLMECGATEVEMSDKAVIRSIKEMKHYIAQPNSKQENVHTGDIAFNKKWPNGNGPHIVRVDASDSAIANEGFRYFKEVRRLETMKLNFCDYFGDEALRELTMGRPAQTLKDLEIVLNPCLTDGAVYWLSRLKSLRRAHFYFLPYVSNRTSFIRQLKLALPKCQVTFPEVEHIGYGYEKEKKSR